MICFYHNDDDGKCAAFLVKLFHNDVDNTDRELFLSCDYSRPFPINMVMQDERIYIVDYSVSPDMMLNLLDITQNVVWIDHHISAIEKYNDFPYQIHGVRDTRASGCMLTWCYFNRMLPENCFVFDTSMTEDAQTVVKLVDDYDMYRFVYGDNTKYFHLGFSLDSHDPVDKIWETLITDEEENFISEIINLGKTCYEYRKNLMDEIIKDIGFEAKLDGYTCFCVNQAFIGSEDFSCIDPSEYDMLIGFSFNGCSWEYQLRSTGDVNVKDVAVRHGGGGHPAAAGFTSDILLLS